MTKPMSLTGFARRVEYIKAHRKDKNIPKARRWHEN